MEENYCEFKTCSEEDKYAAHSRITCIFAIFAETGESLQQIYTVITPPPQLMRQWGHLFDRRL
jgi:hypothetical protein